MPAIKDARKKAGLTQAQVSQISGIILARAVPCHTVT